MNGTNEYKGPIGVNEASKNVSIEAIVKGMEARNEQLRGQVERLEVEGYDIYDSEMWEAISATLQDAETMANDPSVPDRLVYLYVFNWLHDIAVALDVWAYARRMNQRVPDTTPARTLEIPGIPAQTVDHVDGDIDEHFVPGSIGAWEWKRLIDNPTHEDDGTIPDFPNDPREEANGTGV